MYSLIHAWLCIMNPTDTGSASVLSDTRMAVYYINPTDTGSASVLSDTRMAVYYESYRYREC